MRVVVFGVYRAGLASVLLGYGTVRRSAHGLLGRRLLMTHAMERSTECFRITGALTATTAPVAVTAAAAERESLRGGSASAANRLLTCPANGGTTIFPARASWPGNDKDCIYACLGAGKASRSMQTTASRLRVGVDQLQLCMPAAQGHIARLHAVVNPHEPPHP